MSGVVEPIGAPAKLFLFDQRKAVPQEEVAAADHGQAADVVLTWMDAGRISSRGITSTNALDIIGYRVVHGGKSYFDPVRINDEVIARIEALEEPHLEGGSSATAVAAGKSIDTSMGFTPLEGLVMGTRSGDIDPALVAFLARRESVSVDTVEDRLNKKSGLLGISGSSQDTRVLVKHAMSDERDRLALDVFAYRVRKYIGAYLAAIGCATAVVFGGGIGENTPYVRQLVCDGLDWFGLRFDAEKNASFIDREGRISHDDSRLAAFVIPSEEGLNDCS
ncbi:MAG: Acetate kinase [Bryobacterales bacterium]|nr:Acetate kinase [Bryobacterales bacterium]